MPLWWNKKIPGKRGFWGGIWLGGHRADTLWMRPNRGVSRGDRGGVRGWCRVGLRTTSCWRVKLIYWFVGLFLRGNSERLMFRFLNETKAAHLIWTVLARIRLAILPPKLPPKGFGTGQYSVAPLCTHGTKSVLSLGTQYHQTQQNSTVMHKS